MKLAKQTLQPIESAISLHPYFYKSASVFKNEMNTVFKKSWVPVGYTNQFTDNKKVVVSNIGNQSIIMTKNNDNIQAFHNVCRHRGCKLVKNDLKSNLMVCPYHCWSYKLDGSLFKTPQYEPPDKKQFKNNNSLFKIPTKIMKNTIYVNQDGNNYKTPPEKFYKGAYNDIKDYPLEDTKIIFEKTYTANCNWKIIVDNFIEYYHLKSVHPELTAVSGVDEHKCTQKEGEYIGFVTDPITDAETPLDSDFLPIMPNIPINNHKTAMFHAIFPNQFYFLFPSHMFSIILQPISNTKTIEHAKLFIHQDIAKNPHYMYKANKIWKFYDMVNQQDIGICEEVQRGLESDKYNGGKLVPEFESTIHRFHKMYLKYLEL